MHTEKESAFQKEISTIINKFSMESGSDTPDFILAAYLKNCLYAFNDAVKSRDKWFSVDMWTKDKMLPIEKTEEIINEPGN